MQVGDEGDQIHVSASLTDAVDRALHVIRAHREGGVGVGDGEGGIVVGVNSQTGGDVFPRLGNGGCDEFRQASPIGVAQCQHRGPGVLGGLERSQGVFAILPEGVEEMLRVVNHLPALGAKQPDRVGDHRQILFQADAEHVSHLKFAGFSDDGDHRGLGVEQRPHTGVFLCRDSTPASHAERGDFGVFQLKSGHFPEERGILGVGKGESPLDKIHAEEVELLRDLKLVLEREVESLALGSIPKGGVVDFDASRLHGHHFDKSSGPNKKALPSGRASIF